MVNLTDFIHIYDNVLDVASCNILIEFFEAVSGKSLSVNLTDNKTYSEEIETIHNTLLKTTIDFKTDYYSQYSDKVFPDVNSFEKFSIVKCNPSDDEIFTTEVDVLDYDSARRFLCFTFYLNHNSSGQTNFLDLTIHPESGRLLIYPPFWMFPHQEMSPVESSLYKVKTYLHYK